MISRFLEGTRNCCISGGEAIQLEYFLLETDLESDRDLTKSYGIEIVKKCNQCGQTISTETDIIHCLSTEKEQAQEIINKLIANTVTPVSMIYVIEDLLEEIPCV
jgi:hypothetical protein